MTGSKNPDDDFFIGYAPPVPPRLAGFVRAAICGIGAGALVLAVVLAVGHRQGEGGTFEFNYPRTFSGTVVERPLEALRLDGVDGHDMPWPLLVAPGKRGAGELVRGLHERRVTFTGRRIQRGPYSMLEIDASPFVAGKSEADREPDLSSPDLTFEEPLELIGEIVDSKCFLGVMVPAEGKTHLDCASLCLRGGIPPALFVQDRAGRSSLLLLRGPSGESIQDHAVRAAGSIVTVTGRGERFGGWLILRTDPAGWRRAD